MWKELVYHAKKPYHLVKTGLLKGLVAQIKYGFPAKKLKIISITGTDGKTTSSTLLYHVLKQAGLKVALLTTVAAYIGEEEIDTGFHVTTPDPLQLQKFMRKMVDEGFEYLVLEATSHGIYQQRLWGITPNLVGITNITNEHLDYHATYDLYLEAKASLAKRAQTAVINADNELSFSKLKKELRESKTKIHTYSTTDALPKSVETTINQRFPQLYNRMNARLVYTISQIMSIKEKDFITATKQFSGVPGRMEEVGEVNNIKVIVDFAHTANGLLQALTNLRKDMRAQKRKGRLIAAFGCAGLRDIAKRVSMGRTGAEVADLAIFTAEDPRTENVWGIIRQMKQNIAPYHAKVLSIADRREAIFFAVHKLAQPGDVIGIFGKGHEKSMCYGTTEYPWSDVAVAKEALNMLKPHRAKKAKKGSV